MLLYVINRNLPFPVHAGVPITSGVRYILTGFCNYKNTNTDHDVFMSSYDPHYDGFAASEHQQQRFANSVKSSSKEEQSKVMARFEQSSEKSSYDPFDTNKCGIRTGDILKAIWIPELYPGSSNRFKIHETDFVERVNESGCVMESKGGDGDGVIAGAEMTEHKICDNPTVDSQAIREDFKEDTVDIIDADHEGRYGRYVYLDGLSEEKIKSLVALSGMASESITCSVLVQRDDATMEESYLNEEQRNIPRIASNLLSIGKYWSFDEVIESINSH